MLQIIISQKHDTPHNEITGTSQLNVLPQEQWPPHPWKCPMEAGGSERLSIRGGRSALNRKLDEITRGIPSVFCVPGAAVTHGTQSGFNSSSGGQRSEIKVTAGPPSPSPRLKHCLGLWPCNSGPYVVFPCVSVSVSKFPLFIKTLVTLVRVHPTPT